MKQLKCGAPESIQAKREPNPSEANWKHAGIVLLEFVKNSTFGLHTEYYNFIIFSIKIIMAAFWRFATGKPPKNRLSALPAFASIPALRSGTPCGGATIPAAKKGLAIKTRPFSIIKVFCKTRSFQLQQRHTLLCRYSSGVFTSDETQVFACSQCSHFPQTENRRNLRLQSL